MHPPGANDVTRRVGPLSSGRSSGEEAHDDSVSHSHTDPPAAGFDSDDGSVLGIVLGAKARGRVRRTGKRGARLALAAIVVGVITLLVAIAYWIVIAQHVGGGGGGGGGGGAY